MTLISHAAAAARQGVLGQKLRYYSDVVYLTVRADLLAENYRRFLGMLWLFINPILSAFGYYILAFFAFGYSTGDSYAVFLLIGTTFWGWFTETLVGSAGLVLANSSITANIRFPVWIFIFTQNIRSLVLVFAKTGLILAACMLFSGGLDAHILLLPLVMLVQLSLNFCITPFMAILGTFFRDIGSIMGYAASLLMFMSPVIYDVAKIPKQFSICIGLNPFVYILPAYRDILLLHRSPQWLPLLVIFGGSLVVFGIGIFAIQRMRPYFYRFI